MKKRIFSLLLTIGIFTCFITNVSAAVPKAAQISPEIGSEIRAITSTEYFDFSKVVFASEPAGCETCFAGSDKMNKIELSKTGEFTDYFTAYCIDGTYYYPQLGSSSWSSMTNNAELALAVKKAVLESASGIDVISYPDDPAIAGLDFYLEYRLADNTISTSIDNETIASYIAGNSVTINVANIQIKDNSGNVIATYVPTSSNTLVKYINETETPATTQSFAVTVKRNTVDTKTDKYIVYGMEEENVYYNRVLWVLEHSYPSMSLDDALELVGSSKAAVSAELTAAGVANVNDTVIGEYVYSTVQYAVWKVTDRYYAMKDGNKYKLGNEITNKNVFPELNKLYQYLIQDRGESVYKDYDKKAYGDNLTINKPAAGKEIVKQTDEYTKYGPFTVRTDMISVGAISLSINEKDKTGISIVDDPGNEISSVTMGQPFYIKVLKTTKLSKVTVSASIVDALHFSPESNRGRIYSSVVSYQQMVASGGKIIKTSKTIDASIDLNPKTGIEDIATILLITLAAFTMGYLVLRYKNKPLEI